MAVYFSARAGQEKSLAFKCLHVNFTMSIYQARMEFGHGTVLSVWGWHYRIVARVIGILQSFPNPLAHMAALVFYLDKHHILLAKYIYRHFIKKNLIS